jgi:outer membrane murein-binding lipoprotein Lpp
VKRVLLPMTAIAAFALTSSGFAADDSSALSAQVQQLSTQTKQLQREVTALKKGHKKAAKAKAAPAKTAEVKPWNHFVTVTTTSFNGKPASYDGSSLIFNYASINEDLLLLTQRQSLVDQMAAQGYKIDRPILQVSGSVAGELYSASGYHSTPSNGINLSTAEFDFNAIASSWANAFMSLDYNGSPISSGNREPNSSIYLGRGFLTIGNLDVSPIYFSAGQMYVPFGRYANSMVDTPLDESVARIRTPAVLLGFKLNDGLFGSVYGYNGSRTSGHSDLFKQFGVNGGIKNTFGTNNSYELGAGWVSNMGDAQGQQNTGLGVSNTQFSGFAVQQTGQLTSNNDLVHNVDAVDVHGSVSTGPITVISEYDAALRAYSPFDMQFNTTPDSMNGAKPSVVYVEGDYKLPWFPARTSTAFGVSYGHTWEALALNLPENSYAAFLNTSIWRGTQESIEYRYDTDYATADNATGRGATAPIVGTDNGRHSILGEVSVFF